jgi:hypothetical protein
MNILFVLYGDLTSNSANPLGLYARALSERGHDCVVAIPSDSGEADAALAQSLKLVLYADLLAQPQHVFANGRGADVCTPGPRVKTSGAWWPVIWRTTQRRWWCIWKTMSRGYQRAHWRWTIPRSTGKPVPAWRSACQRPCRIRSITAALSRWPIWCC